MSADAQVHPPGPSALWFYAENDTSHGPVDEETIIGLLQSGNVTSRTKVWTKGAKDWRPLADTPLARCLAAAAPPPLPPPIQTVPPPIPVVVVAPVLPIAPQPPPLPAIQQQTSDAPPPTPAPHAPPVVIHPDPLLSRSAAAAASPRMPSPPAAPLVAHPEPRQPAPPAVPPVAPVASPARPPAAVHPPAPAVVPAPIAPPLATPAAVPSAVPPPIPAAAKSAGIIPLTVQPGSEARSTFAEFLTLLHLDAVLPGAAPAPPGAAPKTGIDFWTPKMGETIIGGLLGRKIEPKHFDWLMPLEHLELVDNRSVANGYCGVTKDGKFHVCFHRAGEGFYYAGMPADAVMPRAQIAPNALHLSPDKLVFSLNFPAASGLRTATSPELTADLLDGLTGAWLTFWRPAINSAWGKAGKDLALGRLAECLPEEESFGMYNRFIQDAVVCFRPGKAGLEIFPPPDFDGATFREWSTGDGVLEMLYRKPGAIPTLWRLIEHVPAGGNAVLATWAATQNFGAATRSQKPLSDWMRGLGCFYLLWEGEQEAEDPDFQLCSIAGETIALESLDGDGERIVFERGGFVVGTHALAATAAGRCARLTLATAEEFDALPKFAPAAERWGAWTDGGIGCGVFVQPEEEESAPLPAKLTLSPQKFSVGPFQSVPLRNTDSLVHDDYLHGIDSLALQPGASTPGQPAPKVTILLPTEQAFRVWEEWDVAHAQADLINANVGGFYRGFNEAKKLNLLAVLFSDVVMLNQALNKGTTMEATIEKLEEAGPEALAKDTELRNAVVSKILALVQTLPGIKQKLEMMASMYPYYWVRQEMDWLTTAFGREIAAPLEPILQKRAIPLVRQQVRTIQGNLGRSLAEIEAAARPVDGLLSRNELRKGWKAKARKYLPIGVQGASAIAMIALSHGTYGWTGLATFLASGVAGNVFEGMTQDAESVNQIGRAAQTIFPWWRVFLGALVTTQFEFSQFVDEENQLAMKRDRALLDKVPEAGKKAATARLVAALRTRIIEERRNRFSELLAGSGVRLLSVVDDLEKTIKKSARQDVDEFIAMLRFDRHDQHKPGTPPSPSAPPATPPPANPPTP